MFRDLQHFNFTKLHGNKELVILGNSLPMEWETTTHAWAPPVVFTLKTAHQMFSTPSTVRQRNSVTAHFRFHFVFENKLGHGNHMLFREFIIDFEKPRLQQNVFRRPGWNTKPPFSDSYGLMSVLKKLRFLWWISVDGRLNRGNKAAFSNFFHVMWTGLMLQVTFYRIFNVFSIRSLV